MKVDQSLAPIRRIKEVLAYENRWIRVFFDEVIFPDGRSGRYNRIDEGEGGKATGVVILPILDDNKIVLVRQFRYPTGKFMLEFPRGFGNTKLSPLENAKKELEEETRYTTDDLEELGNLHPNSGLLSTGVGVFIARKLRRVMTGSQSAEQNEVAEVVTLDLQTAESLIADGEITDGFTISALFLFKAKERLRSRF